MCFTGCRVQDLFTVIKIKIPPTETSDRIKFATPYTIIGALII